MKTDTHTEPFAASGGWAALAKMLTRRENEARRMSTVYSNRGDAWAESHCYGKIAALGELRRYVERKMKARPNAEVSDSRREKP